MQRALLRYSSEYSQQQPVYRLQPELTASNLAVISLQYRCKDQRKYVESFGLIITEAEKRLAEEQQQLFIGYERNMDVNATMDEIRGNAETQLLSLVNPKILRFISASVYAKECENRLQYLLELKAWLSTTKHSEFDMYKSEFAERYGIYVNKAPEIIKKSRRILEVMLNRLDFIHRLAKQRGWQPEKGYQIGIPTSGEERIDLGGLKKFADSLAKQYEEIL